MITIYSEKKEVRNSAMPLQKKNRVDTESIISDSLIKMRELIKNDLRSVEKIGWRKEEKQKNKKPKVAFVCVHNSCRSQIAECLGKLLATDVFDSYSAGTEPKSKINSDAVRIIKEMYGLDMEKTQYSKTIGEIPQPDVAIFMGCNVKCPIFPSQYSEN